MASLQGEPFGSNSWGEVLGGDVWFNQSCPGPADTKKKGAVARSLLEESMCLSYPNQNQNGTFTPTRTMV